MLAVIVYCLSAVYSLFLWRKGFRLHDHANYILLLIGFALQMKAMLMRGLMHGQCPVNNLYEAVAFVDAAEVPKGLKVLSIDGKLPGQAGYPLR